MSRSSRQPPPSASGPDKWEPKLPIRGERLRVKNRFGKIVIWHEHKFLENRARAYGPLLATTLAVAALNLAGLLGLWGLLVYVPLHIWLYPRFDFEDYAFGNLKLSFYSDAIIIERVVSQWLQFRPYYPRVIVRSALNEATIATTSTEGVVGIMHNNYFERLFKGYDSQTLITLSQLVREAWNQPVTAKAPERLMTRRQRQVLPTRLDATKPIPPNEPQANDPPSDPPPTPGPSA